MYIKHILCSEVDFSSNSTFFFNMELMRSVLTRSAYSEERSRIKNNKLNAIIDIPWHIVKQSTANNKANLSES